MVGKGQAKRLTNRYTGARTGEDPRARILPKQWSGEKPGPICLSGAVHRREKGSGRPVPFVCFLCLLSHLVLRVCVARATRVLTVLFRCFSESILPESS